MSRNVYITGFMGSGKTTVGRALSEKLNRRAVDLDEWIEKREQMEIRQIFAEKGEAYFRDLETKTLQAVKGPNLIITTGGGIVTRTENREWMKKHGIVVYLRCELNEIMRRLKGDKSRPNFRGDRKAMERLFQSRKAAYEEADIIVDTTEKSVAQIVAEISERLKRYESGNTTR